MVRLLYGCADQFKGCRADFAGFEAGTWCVCVRWMVRFTMAIDRMETLCVCRHWWIWVSRISCR